MKSLLLGAPLLAAMLFASPAAPAPLPVGGVSVGDKAPEWELKEWFNSRPFKLSQLGGKGILLEFWASW